MNVTSEYRKWIHEMDRGRGYRKWIEEVDTGSECN